MRHIERTVGHMNTSKTKSLLWLPVLAATLACWPVYEANAANANGTWNTTTSGASWNTAGNWLSGTIADGSGYTAYFNQLNITADTTVNLNGFHYIGKLVFGDTDTSSAAGWLLSTANSSSLYLIGGTRSITVNALDTGKSVTISTVINGTDGLTKLGAGKLILSGNNNYLDTSPTAASTLISGGTLSVSQDNSTTHNLGSYSPTVYGITLSGGGTLEVTGDLYASGQNYLTRSIALGAGGGTVVNSAPGSLYLGRYGTGTPNGGAITGGNGLTTRGGDISLYPKTQNTLGSLTVASGRTFLRDSGGNAYALKITDTVSVLNGATLGFTDSYPWGGVIRLRLLRVPTSPVVPRPLARSTT